MSYVSKQDVKICVKCANTYLYDGGCSIGKVPENNECEYYECLVHNIEGTEDTVDFSKYVDMALNHFYTEPMDIVESVDERMFKNSKGSFLKLVCEYLYFEYTHNKQKAEDLLWQIKQHIDIEIDDRAAEYMAAEMSDES